MKKIIAYSLAWGFYYLGDLVSNTKLFSEGKYEWPYILYRNCMNWSSDIQDWGKLKGPWTDVNN